MWTPPPGRTRRATVRFFLPLSIRWSASCIRWITSVWDKSYGRAKIIIPAKALDMPSNHISPTSIQVIAPYRYLYVAISTVKHRVTDYLGNHTNIWKQIWLWDMIISISTEVETFFWRRIRLVDLIYMLSRWDTHVHNKYALCSVGIIRFLTLIIVAAAIPGVGSYSTKLDTLFWKALTHQS